MGVKVVDPFDAGLDSDLPSLALALDPEAARKALKRGLPRLSGRGTLRLRKIRVIRHKPGRRCVVKYEVQVLPPEPASRVNGAQRTPSTCSPEGVSAATIIGKVRARRFGNEGYRLQQAFYEKGFSSESPDGVSVPEPLGVIPELQMWFQRKVPGATAQSLLREALAAGDLTESLRLSRQIGAAIHKVHAADVAIDKRHGMEDELRILEVCLRDVAQSRPEWEPRLKQVMAACARAGSSLPPPRTKGIHRDFYASQVIVGPGRLWLIDFDLYCTGDPGLDIGNFVGHVTELALREAGDPDALKPVELAIEDAYVSLAGRGALPYIQVYTTLTLARHIFLSCRFPERRQTTERLLCLCEARLGLPAIPASRLRRGFVRAGRAD